MRFWLELDEELIGDLDSAGCYHGILAVDHILDVYEITDPEDRRDARRLLRCLGTGRAESFSEDV